MSITLARASAGRFESRVRATGYNTLKVRVLRVLARNDGWMRPGVVWVEAEMPGPVRSMWSYLGRLAKWGLLRKGSLSGRIAYQISAKGRERLNWLEQDERGQKRAL